MSRSGVSGASRFASVVFFTAAAAGAAACSDETPQDRIRALVAEAEAGAEARDTERLAALLAEEFTDQGGRDRTTIAGFLGLYLARTDAVHVLTRIREIRLTGEGSAEVSLVAAVAERRVEREDDLAGVEADLWRFRLDVREGEGGRWRVYAAEWTRIGLRDF